MEENKENSESEVYLSMKSVIPKTLEFMENQVLEPDENFLKSGIENLDFHNGDFALLCGFSGYGKTEFALNILNNLAVKKQIPAAYISCGFTDTEEFGRRLISLNSKIPYSKLTRVMMNIEDFEEAKKTCESLYDSPLFFRDLPNPSFFLDIEPSCFYLKENKNVKFIVLDSLDYFQEILDSKDEEFRDTLEKLLDDFRELAKNLKIPILVLAEVPFFKFRENNDNYFENKNFKKYVMIQRKADMIMLLERNYDYDKAEKIERDFSLEIIKNNYGKTCSIYLESYLPAMKFSVKD